MNAAPVIQFPKAKKPSRHLHNAKQIDAIKPPTKEEAPGGGVDWSDPTTPGLTLRVTWAGTKTWAFRYSNPQGLMRRLPLGEFGERPKVTLADARDRVADCRKLLRDGKDPATVKEERRTATLFGDLFQRWLEGFARVELKGGGVEEERAITADVLPAWKQRPADEITKADLLDILTPKRQAGHNVAANRLRAHISRMFNWGIDHDLVTRNPVKGTRKSKERSKDRVLTADELRRVWLACDQLPVHQAVWFKLRAVTGQRGGELLQMRRRDIASDGWWTIPGTFTKNALPHPIYLSELARELLASLPQSAADGPYDPVWVFPCGETVVGWGKNKGQLTPGANASKLNVMGDYKKISRRLAQPDRANIVVNVAIRNGRRKSVRLKADFTGHDMRRTMSTFLVAGGVSEELLRTILNHSKRESDNVTAVYNRYRYQDEKRAIMDFWAAQLRLILVGDDVAKAGKFSMTPATPANPLLTAMAAILASEAQNLSPAARVALEALQKAGEAS
jgi:integrase